ncbi:MAG: hypothetical protein M0Q54_12885, partial [Pigmentiphaga sp.]|nr:hypothetical protein [Pigmentiphaga sp.]
PDVIVTADGQHEGNQQAVGVLNGIESEGLVQHNDSWRGFSRATNTHEYWRKFNNLPYPFRYVVLKFQNANDAANIDRLRRFSVASACALEAYNTYPDDFDFLPAWVKSKSLGKAKGELIRVAKQSPKLLSDNINTIGETYLNAIDCKVEYTPEGIILSAKSDAQTSLSFEFKNMDLPAGDLTFFIDSKSLDPLHGFTNEDRVPRILYTEFSNLPDYGEGVNVNKLYTDLYGMIGTYDFYENAFYYRRPKVEAGKQTLKFKVDGGGKILIRAFQAYNKPDILIKEFEHAIVCVNPSLEAQSVNLTTDKLPGLNANKSIIVDPVDAVFLKNINTGNTGFIEANEQNPGKTKILKINGGMHSFNFKNTKAQINIWDITGRKIKSSEINNDKILFHLPENNLYMVQIITV